MSGWTDLASQAVTALLGTVAGGAITLFVTRWQTAKTIVSQSELAASQQLADAQLARAEREGAAARLLLERLADFYQWLPSLPDVSLEAPKLSDHARRQCVAAMESIRRGMHTELFSIQHSDVRERYRTLVKLAYDAGW